MAKPKNKSPWYFLKRADGVPSLSVTMVLIAFWVTTLVYIMSAFDSILQWHIKPFDPAAVSAYLIPILTMYAARRHTESNAKKPDIIEEAEEDLSE